MPPWVRRTLNKELLTPLVKAAPPLDREPNCRPAMGRDMDIFGWTKGQQRQKQAPALPERCTTRAKPHFRSFNLKAGNLEHRTRKFGPERTL